MRIDIQRPFKQQDRSKFSSWKLGQHKKIYVTFEKGPYIPAYGKSNLMDLYLELETSNIPTVDEIGTIFTG